jgi:nicotinamidase/pyrazinamidase
MKKALILVDIQNDFCPGGALAVAEGDAVVGLANRIAPTYDLVVATQDWHPAHHESFASHHGKTPGTLVELHGLPQVLWPDHCVADTPGAKFHPALDLTHVAKVFPKGTDPTIDSYSGFFDNGHRHATGLGDYLQAAGVTDVDVIGLATDYCVKFTALDAQALGFKTRVLVDACRGVELQAGDVERALQALRDAHITVTTTKAQSVSP